MKEYIIEGVKFTQKDKITPKQYVKINELLDKYIDSSGEIGKMTNSFVNAIMKVLLVKPIELVDILVETEDKTIIKYDFIENKFSMDDINEVTEHFFENNDISSTLLSLAKIKQKEVIKGIEKRQKVIIPKELKES